MNIKNWILTASAGLALLGGTNSYAIFDPSWERPIFESKLQIQKVSADFENVKTAQLTVTKLDGQPNYTGMILQLDRNTEIFKILKQVKDRCGSTVYYAENVENPAVASNERYHLTLVDHSTRLCDDVRSLTWEVKLEELVNSVVQGTMKLAGNPEAVVTIQ